MGACGLHVIAPRGCNNCTVLLAHYLLFTHDDLHCSVVFEESLHCYLGIGRGKAETNLSPAQIRENNS